MRITVLSFQQHRNAGLEPAEAEYLKRLSRHAKVELRTARLRNGDGAVPDDLLKAQRIVGLFVEGESFSSEEMAGKLRAWMNAGCSHLVLVIGGADGMPRTAVAQIREKWSMSRLTFSHQLLRLLLLEALYRSFDILHGRRYHK